MAANVEFALSCVEAKEGLAVILEIAKLSVGLLPAIVGFIVVEFWNGVLGNAIDIFVILDERCIDAI